MRSLNDTVTYLTNTMHCRTSWPDEISGIKEKSYRSKKTRMNITKEERENREEKKERKKNRNLLALYIIF